MEDSDDVERGGLVAKSTSIVTCIGEVIQGVDVALDAVGVVDHVVEDSAALDLCVE